MGVTCSLSLMATKFFHFWSTTSKWPHCLAVPACNGDATAAQQTQSSELLFDHKHKAVHRLCHQQISVLCSVPIYLHVYVCGPYTTMHKENRGKKSVLGFIPCGHLRCAKSQCTVIWQQPFLLSRKIEPIRMKYNEEMGCLSVKKPHPSTSAADETGSNVITHTERREFKNLAEFPKRDRGREIFIWACQKKKKPTKNIGLHLASAFIWGWTGGKGRWGRERKKEKYCEKKMKAFQSATLIRDRLFLARNSTYVQTAILTHAGFAV